MGSDPVFMQYTDLAPRNTTTGKKMFPIKRINTMLFATTTSGFTYYCIIALFAGGTTIIIK
jgi:hypothetical protein